MWSTQYLGGNGHTSLNSSLGCVDNGPFANRTLHIGPLEKTTDYCFAREFNNTRGVEFGARSNVDACYEFDDEDFESFFGCMVCPLLFFLFLSHPLTLFRRSTRTLPVTKPQGA